MSTDKGLIPTSRVAALLSAIEACTKQTTRLSAILDDVLPEVNYSKWQRGRKALRSLRRERVVLVIQSSIESSKVTFALYYVRHPVSLQIWAKPS